MPTPASSHLMNPDWSRASSCNIDVQVSVDDIFDAKGKSNKSDGILTGLGLHLVILMCKYQWMIYLR